MNFCCKSPESWILLFIKFYTWLNPSFNYQHIKIPCLNISHRNCSETTGESPHRFYKPYEGLEADDFYYLLPWLRSRRAIKKQETVWIRRLELQAALTALISWRSQLLSGADDRPLRLKTRERFISQQQIPQGTDYFLLKSVLSGSRGQILQDFWINFSLNTLNTSTTSSLLFITRC